MAPANLVIRPEKLGDLIVATPVFRAFKESFPDEPLHLLTDEVFAEAVRHDPHLDKIISVRWKGSQRDRHESWLSLYRKLSPQQYKRAALLYYGQEEWNWLMAALRIPQVAQLGGTWSSFLFGHRRVLRRMHQERLHYAEWYMRVAGQLGVKAVPVQPQIYLSKEEIAAFESRFQFVRESRQCVFIHPFGYGSSPNMHQDHYARLARRLIQELGVEVYLSGTADDAKNLSAEWPKEIHRDWLGTLTIREWMVASTKVSLVICGSTGVAHLAAAAGTPLLGIYCPYMGSHPDIWGPIGSKVKTVIAPNTACQRIQPDNSPCTGNNQCDLGLIIDQRTVFDAAREMLGR